MKPNQYKPLVNQAKVLAEIFKPIRFSDPKVNTIALECMLIGWMMRNRKVTVAAMKEAQDLALQAVSDVTSKPKYFAIYAH